MEEEFLIPVELNGTYMDADWLYRQHGFLQRGNTITRKIRAVKAGSKQVRMTYGAQRRFLNESLTYKTWPCYMSWDGVLYSNPRTQYRAEVDTNLLCFIFGFYSVKVDHEGNPELDDNNKPQVTFNEEALWSYLRTFKKNKMYTLVMSYDDQNERDFIESLDIVLPRTL